MAQMHQWLHFLRRKDGGSQVVQVGVCSARLKGAGVVQTKIEGPAVACLVVGRVNAATWNCGRVCEERLDLRHARVRGPV